MRSIAFCAACFALVLTLSLGALAQQPAAATLTGRVIDPNGAVVPGTQVTATHKATGVKRETTSNGEGIFVIPNLPPGEYEVRAKAANFAESAYSISLQVGQATNLDIALRVQLITETIVDYGGPELINTSTSVVDSVINRREVENLPLNGRDFPELALLIPGNSPAPLNDLLTTNRVDWNPTAQDQTYFRYSLEREDDVAASTLIRSIGSASQRQSSRNNTQSFLANYTRTLTPRDVNNFNFSASTFINRTEPVTIGPQLTFPSLQDGASFRVPQQTRQRRFQFADTFTAVRGNHTLNFDGEIQRVNSDFNLGVFQQGRIELIEDFPDFDRNGDGRVDDNDLLFAVTLRSAFPDHTLIIPDANNTYFAAFVQDDWRVTPQLTLNLGLRYELDTDFKNVSRVDEINPLVAPFLHGTRGRDTNNFGTRFGFNYASADGRTSIHGGYGIYYDRITLEIQSLERGLDGRALPIEVRAGNIFFLQPQCLFNPACGTFPPPAPTLANPFTGFILPGAGAAGINIIANDMQNPMVQQMNLGVQRELWTNYVFRADYLHDYGTHFIIGRTISEVFNLFNVTNVLGVSNVNYSGFSNVLVRDSNDPASMGFLRSSSFGRPVTTAGGVFGSGGPRAFQLAVRWTF